MCQSWYSRWHLQHSNSERKFVLRLGSFRETTTMASPRSFPFSFTKKKKKKNSRTRRFPRAAIICLSRSWSVAVYSWLCFAFSLPSKQSEWKDRQDLKKSLTMCFVQMRQNSIPVSIFIFLVYYHYDLQHFSSNELVHF